MTINKFQGQRRRFASHQIRGSRRVGNKAILPCNVITRQSVKLHKTSLNTPMECLHSENWNSTVSVIWMFRRKKTPKVRKIYSSLKKKKTQEKEKQVNFQSLKYWVGVAHFFNFVEYTGKFVLQKSPLSPQMHPLLRPWIRLPQQLTDRWADGLPDRSQQCAFDTD